MWVKFVIYISVSAERFNVDDEVRDIESGTCWLKMIPPSSGVDIDDLKTLLIEKLTSRFPGAGQYLFGFNIPGQRIEIIVPDVEAASQIVNEAVDEMLKRE